MSDTLSVQHTKREPLPMSEKNTVDRAIEIEDRVAELHREIDALQTWMEELSEQGASINQLEQEEEELFAELFELKREYRG